VPRVALVAAPAIVNRLRIVAPTIAPLQIEQTCTGFMVMPRALKRGRAL